MNTRLGDRFTAGATYTVYHSPNATFGTVEELAFSVGFDDTGLLSDSFALKPNLVVAFELDGQADAGSHVGTYGQIGVEPAFAVGKLGDLDITVSVPVTIGLSLSDYYEYGTGDDDFLGFVDIGIAATSPLPFLPARLGPWSGTLALHALLLGDNNETAHHGDANAFVLSFGLSTTF